jgi:hypothetical protein
MKNAPADASAARGREKFNGIDHWGRWVGGCVVESTAKWLKGCIFSPDIKVQLAIENERGQRPCH